MKLTKQGVRDLGGHRPPRIRPVYTCPHIWEREVEWDCCGSPGTARTDRSPRAALRSVGDRAGQPRCERSCRSGTSLHGAHGATFAAVARYSAGDDYPTPTQLRVPPAGHLALERIEIDLSDPEALAEFLEAVARVIRLRRRIVLSIE